LTSSHPASSVADVFVGHSEMAEMMRRHDWQSSTLGPPERWPEALKVALRILLTSRFDMWLGWGPDINFFYNDAYRPTLGKKHPHALGMPARVLWPEIWDDLKGRMEAVYRDGQASWDSALLLILERSGYREETYHTFSYSPLLGDTGKVEGLFCVVMEETLRVISERRLATLSDLAAGLAKADGRQAVLDAASAALGRATHDLPFTLTYFFDAHGDARLASSTGMPPGHALAPPRLAREEAGRWAVERILRGEPSVHLPLDGCGSELPTGAWDRPPGAVIVMPIAAQGMAEPAGFIVAGLNPYRSLDDDYLSFLSQRKANLRGRHQAEALAEINIEIENIRSLSEFQRNAKHHIKRLKKTGKPEVLTVNGRAEVVVQDAASYQRLLAELEHAQSVSQVRIGLEQAKRGEGRPMRQAIEEIAARHGIKLRK